MLIAFMIARARGLAVLGVGVCLALGGATIGCQRVPLLAPSGSTITLTASASVLPFGGTADIIGQVIEPSGTPPHSGTHVTFTTNLGTIQPADAETDTDGRVVVKFSAGNTSGTATINAISGGVAVASGSAVKISIGAAAVGGINLAASPSTVSASGGASTITAKVIDTNGNAIAGVPVSFVTDNGALSQSLSNTDQSGAASVVLTTSRTAKVTASAGLPTTTSGTGGTTSTTAAPSATVTVTVNTTSAITAGAVSPATPGVGQTVSVPLTYSTTTGGSPVTSIRVDWGDGRIQNYSGQPGVITHSYGSAGSFVILITGFDSFGDTSTASASVTVLNSNPSVGLSPDNDNPSAGTAVTFTISAAIPGSPTGVDIVSIHIDYGDGAGADLGPTATSAKHTYIAPGTYTAVVIATATNGQTGSARATIVVK
jgi:adhesin/invasin